MRNILKAVAAAVFVLGAASMLPFTQHLSAADKSGADSFEVAQARYCRGNEKYRPRHPQADPYGCVDKRHLRDARREARRSSGQTAIESGHGVTPDKCDGTYKGGLCKGGYYVDIKFSQPFSARPHVLVSIESVSDQGGCVGGATDKVVSYPTNITRRGFRLYAFGSPFGGSCGKLSSWASRAKAGWIAVGFD